MLVGMAFMGINLSAQTNPWIEKTKAQTTNEPTPTLSEKYKVKLFKLNTTHFISQPNSNDEPLTQSIVLPLTDGSFHEFEISPSQVMHPELAEKYPSIQSFKGRSLSSPAITLRLDWGPNGLHAMVSHNFKPNTFIEPDKTGSQDEYIVYTKGNSAKQSNWGCHAHEVNDFSQMPEVVWPSFRNAECKLRTYRLALSCTGEYAQYHGGSIEKALAAMATTINRVNEIFERDLGVHLEMVPNNDELIFLLPNADPFNNTNGNDLLFENQTVCDVKIGSENYDIGHVLSTGGGGIAFVGSVCDENSKACGVTGSPYPEGDAFDIDYVAHEMGHQFGANHTQNNPCNRNPATSVEPGSGSTIMSYAGVCSPNVQVQSDAYFHAISIGEIKNFLSGSGNSCASVTGGNHCPSADAGADFVIPRLTPFALAAIANDNDPEDELTYCWEQMDNQAAIMPPVAGNHAGPAFRSMPPSSEPQRFFPNMNSLLRGENELWEVLPNQERKLNFMLTVRDNHLGGGCTAQDELTLHVDAGAGPFEVNEPTGNSTWKTGESEKVYWDVAKTNLPPINCSYVDIFLSIDGGNTWSFQLAGNTKNDGEHDINVPNFPCENARIMIKSRDNVFFAISDGDFPIIEASEFSVSVNTSDVICHGERNGKASIIASGGEGNYKFLWSTGSIDESIEGLFAGNYQVTVSSGNEEIVREIIITEPDALNLNLIGSDANQGSNGQIISRPNGGNGDYTFQWGNGFTYPNLYHLPSGNYSLTVTDKLGCSASSSIQLSGTPPLPLEYGSIENVGESWQVIELENSYENMVVVTSIELAGKGTASVVTRVKPRDEKSFELKLQRAGESDYPFQASKVHYVVAEEGVYTDDEYGIDFEAVKITSNRVSTKGNWFFEKQRFTNSYASPVVLGQVMSFHDHKWSAFWSSIDGRRNQAPISSSFSIGKHAGQDIRDEIGPTEEIGYLVFESGSGFINGKKFVAAVGKDKVRGVADAAHGYAYALDGFSQTDIAIVSAAGMDDDEGAWPVLYDNSPTPSVISTFALEDQCQDNERSHSSEQVAYLVFGTESFDLNGDPISEQDASERPDPDSYLLAYPTPSPGIVNLEFFQSENGGPEVVLYDLYGREKNRFTMIHASPGFRKETVNLSDLPPGTYVLQILEGRSKKTIKIILI